MLINKWNNATVTKCPEIDMKKRDISDLAKFLLKRIVQ
jgi:hypothetical protein